MFIHNSHINCACGRERGARSPNGLEQDALLQSPSFGLVGMESFARWQPLEEVFGQGCVSFMIFPALVVPPPGVTVLQGGQCYPSGSLLPVASSLEWRCGWSVSSPQRRELPVTCSSILCPPGSRWSWEGCNGSSASLSSTTISFILETFRSRLCRHHDDSGFTFSRWSVSLPLEVRPTATNLTMMSEGWSAL